MAQLDYFKQFIAKDETEINVNRAVWSYTRVSSKEQFEQWKVKAKQLNVESKGDQACFYLRKV